MKLIFEIDLPEQEIDRMIAGIPAHWFFDSEETGIRKIAMALVDAYRKAKQS